MFQPVLLMSAWMKEIIELHLINERMKQLQLHGIFSLHDTPWKIHMECNHEVLEDDFPFANG